MRIGIDARELQGHPTGAGRYLRNLLRAWPTRDDDIHLYFTGAAPPDPVLARPGVIIRPVGGRRHRGLDWQERILPPVANADRLDVFFAPAYFLPLALAMPRVVAIHDMAPYSVPHDFSPREGMRRRLLLRWALASAQRILTISEFSAREIASFFPAVASRVRMIHLAADTDMTARQSREAARKTLLVDGPMLLTVGSILNRRHLPQLFEAVRILARTWPRLVLDVVGDNRTSPRLDFDALARRMGITRNVCLSGFVDEASLALRYAAADVAVYLSDYEGFGLPVLEALHHDLPVVTSRHPATGELFKDAAVLVDPEDPRQIALELWALLADPQRRAGWAQVGRARAKLFSWEKTAVATRAVLQEAIAG